MDKILPASRLRVTLSAAVLFVLLATLYFLPVDIPYKIAFPLILLTVFSPWVLPWQMCLAMLFSAAGDVAGACGSFLMQTGFFSIAHIMLILYFIPRALKENLYSWAGYSSGRGNGRFVYIFIITIISFGLLAYALTVFAPLAEDGTVTAAVGIYAALIVTMLWSALLQRDLAFAAGAILFVLSDFFLGWHSFASPVSGEKYLIMVPYYLAQLILFLRSSVKSQVYR